MFTIKITVLLLRLYRMNSWPSWLGSCRQTLINPIFLAILQSEAHNFPKKVGLLQQKLVSRIEVDDPKGGASSDKNSLTLSLEGNLGFTLG